MMQLSEEFSSIIHINCTKVVCNPLNRSKEMFIKFCKGNFPTLYNPGMNRQEKHIRLYNTAAKYLIPLTYNKINILYTGARRPLPANFVYKHLDLTSLFPHKRNFRHCCRFHAVSLRAKRCYSCNVD